MIGFDFAMGLGFETGFGLGFEMGFALDFDIHAVHQNALWRQQVLTQMPARLVHPGSALQRVICIGYPRSFNFTLTISNQA